MAYSVFNHESDVYITAEGNGYYFCATRYDSPSKALVREHAPTSANEGLPDEYWTYTSIEDVIQWAATCKRLGLKVTPDTFEALYEARRRVQGLRVALETT